MYETFVAPVVSAAAKSAADVRHASREFGLIPDSRDAQALADLQDEASDILESYAEACIRGCARSIFTEFTTVSRVVFQVSETDATIHARPVDADGVALDAGKGPLAGNPMLKSAIELVNSFAAGCMDGELIHQMFDGRSINRDGVIFAPSDSKRGLKF